MTYAARIIAIVRTLERNGQQLTAEEFDALTYVSQPIEPRAGYARLLLACGMPRD